MRFRLCLLSGPFRRQYFLALRKCLETLDVVVEPQVKLEILCRQLNVLQIVQKFAKCAGLQDSSQWIALPVRLMLCNLVTQTAYSKGSGKLQWHVPDKCRRQ